MRGSGEGLSRRTLTGAMLTALALIATVSTPRVASASRAGWELWPFVGYTTAATFDGSGTILPGKLETKGSLTFGGAIGTTTPQNIGIEVMYTYQDNGVVFKMGGSPEMDVSDLAVHQIHGNFLFYLPHSYTAPTKPYFLIGLGASIFDLKRDNWDNETRFTWALGLGVKHDVNEKLGLRVQGRYTPTYLNSDYGGTWCDPYYGCYAVPDANYLDQWDFTGGLVFHLGRS